MNRMISATWQIFKLLILPLAIVLSVALPNQSLVELFRNLAWVINGAFGDSEYTTWIANSLAAPLALTSWIIPSAVSGGFLILAAIFGNFGIWVILILTCACISAPRCLQIEESGSRIPFVKAVMTLALVAGLGIIYDATRVNFFDDSYKGHLVVNGKVTDVPASVIFSPGRYGRKPSVMVSVQGDREALGFKDSYSYFIDNNPGRVWCKIDDFSSWPDGRYYVDMRTSPIPACKQAVMTPNGFDGMTLEVNRGLPGAFEVRVDRQYRQNPIILGIQYLQFAGGGFAKI